MSSPFRSIAFLILFPVVLIGVAAQAGNVSSAWIGHEGNWTDGSLWSTAPNFPKNGSDLYSVTIETALLTLDQDIQIEELSLGGAATPALYVTNGARTLEVRSKLLLNQGYFLGSGTLKGTGTTNIIGTVWLNGWNLLLDADTTWSGTLALSGSTIENGPDAILTLSDGARSTPFFDGSRILNNFGTINAKGGPNEVALDLTFNNFGTVNVQSSRLYVMGGGAFDGVVNISSGATLYFEQTQRVQIPEDIVFGPNSLVVGDGSITFNSHAHCYVNGRFNVGGTVLAVSDVTFLAPAERIGRSLILSGVSLNVDTGSSTITLDDLQLLSGTLTGSGNVTVNNPLKWGEGSLTGTGKIIASSGVIFRGLTNTSAFNFLDRVLECHGNSSFQPTGGSLGTLYFDTSAVLNIMPGAIFDGSRLNILGSTQAGLTKGLIRNQGTFIVNAAGMFASGTNFINEGVIQIVNAALDVRSTAGQPGLTQSGGSILLQNGTLPESVQLNGGSLSGYGKASNLINNATITPAGGSINFSAGTLALQPGSVLQFALKSSSPGAGFGQLVNISSATLNGSLQVSLDPSYQKRVRATDKFVLMSAQALTGKFLNATNGRRLTTTDRAGSFLVTINSGGVQLSKFKAAKKKGGH